MLRNAANYWAIAPFMKNEVVKLNLTFKTYYSITNVLYYILSIIHYPLSITNYQITLNFPFYIITNTHFNSY